MVESVIEWVWVAAGLYALAGVVLLVPFHIRALRTIDEGTVGAGLGFRVLISPSLVALWPIVLRRWRGAGSVASPDRPVSATTLRRTQKNLTRLVAVVVPVVVGVAIAGRGEYSVISAPEMYTSNVEVNGGSAFDDLPIRFAIGSDGRLAVAVDADLELPTAVLYVDNGVGEKLSESAAALGGIWGPASFSYAIPARAGSDSVLKVYSLSDGAVVGVANLAGAGS